MAEDTQAASAEPSQQTFEVRVEATETGRYANHVLLLRTPNELFLDFFFVEPPLPPGNAASHVARIILPTTVLEGFLRALREQMEERGPEQTGKSITGTIQEATSHG